MVCNWKVIMAAGLWTASGVASAASVESTAWAVGSDDAAPVLQATSSVPGVHVSRDAQGIDKFAGSAYSSATSSTVFGINRVGGSAQLVYRNLISDTDNGSAFASSYSYSRFEDEWIVTGGNLGDIVTLRFSGSVDYALAVHPSISLVSNPAVQIYASFMAFSSFDGRQVDFSTPSFGTGLPLDWAISLQARSGESLTVTSYLSMYLEASFFGSELGVGSKSAAFDAMNSATWKSITVDDGYQITAASGELLRIDDRYLYRVAAVPEPHAYALMVMGLIAVGWRARRRG